MFPRDPADPARLQPPISCLELDIRILASGHFDRTMVEPPYVP